MNLNQIIQSLVEDVDDLKRRQRNQIREGHVVRLEGRKVVVDYASDSDDEYVSPLIPWLPDYAGEVLTWRAPSIGERAIVLNLSGGDDEAHAVALPAMYSTAFQPDDIDPDKTYTSINDVFRVTADKQGNYLLEAAKSVKVITPSYTVEAADEVVITTSQYKRTADTAITKGIQTQTGNLSVTGSLDVSVDIKTPAIMSYAPGAFAITSAGAVLSSAKINNIEFIAHVHPVIKEGQPTQTPVSG
ncbi:phage baseplate assembly protein V [Photobacterium sp. WH24]|uniref:phage baseplate assembly protein V n=1 Tax=Photobacterium sp. WH24 TaxID=2827237 RepID=UPI001C47BBF5|nr:phage baseplate assembly protein V [Photobacterium sp. WH24]MBV7264320.1 phage baseplate assembly protein V [Photobacterium sp. WH24]